MVKVLTTAIAVAFIAIPATAHDFWLQPAKFVLAKPGSIPIMTYVGHGASKERWALPIDRVVSFQTIGPEGVTNRKALMTLRGPRHDAKLPLTRRGAHLITFQSSPSFSELPFQRFNDYVAEEGLTIISQHRQQAGAQQATGRERYSRRAKVIVQVGAVDAASVKRVTRPTGLSLEIVPEQHPLLLKLGQPLAVRVVFKGEPLAGALVKLTNLKADSAPLKMARTDNAGRAMFKIPKGGQWQFNVIWADITPGNATADYETTFSSLTFGT